MNIITIDLGTTNVKVSAYTRDFQVLEQLNHTVKYIRDGERVEFDPKEYAARIKEMVCQAAAAAWNKNGHLVCQIVLTGQAESLVLLDRDGEPITNAISWLDMRSRKESQELSARFPPQVSYPITGQPEMMPTWPITKMLWINRNEPELFRKTATYLLLKDYIGFALSGNMVGEYSIYSFSHYFDITQKSYWREILNYCGVRMDQLPPLVEPCTLVGAVVPELAQSVGMSRETQVNIGTLDHFAGMIGTGNISEGVVSESSGTVLSIAALIHHPDFRYGKLPINCGPFPGSYVLLPVCESGGFSLEWFKNNFAQDMSFAALDQAVGGRTRNHPPIFLPYLTGSNAPDYNENASGVFFGLRAEHDRIDCARSVMEGVACLLRKNLEYMAQQGVQIRRIISTGGGAKSSLWTQIKADITGQPIDVPSNAEAPSLGAAIIGAVSQGHYIDYESAVEQGVSTGRKYAPTKERTEMEELYQVSQKLYFGLAEIYAL